MAQLIPETSTPEKSAPPNKTSPAQALADKIRPDKPSPPQLVFGEILSFAYDTFCSNKVRFALTSLGMVIGTASLILVVTIGMTGKQYILNQIQSIGTNWIYAEYQGGAQRVTNAPDDPLTLDDMNAARQEVPGIIAASPVVPLADRIPVGNGKERDVQILGVYPEYSVVRNLVVVSGRFFDAQDEQAHNKVGVITEKLARGTVRLAAEPPGKLIKISGLPFTVIGTFKEARGYFRPIGSHRQHHRYPLQRRALFHRHVQSEADLLFRHRSIDGCARHSADQTHYPVPPPA